MSTMSTTFAATGVGPSLYMSQPNPQQTMTYQITGSFTATLAWQFSPDNTNWTTLLTFTGTTGPTIQRGTGYYRWACIAYTSGSPVCTLVNSPYIFQQIINSQGQVVFQVDDNGITNGSALTKTSFFGAAPVAQQATTGTATGFTAGSNVAVQDVSTFTGGVGSTAYRISDIVLALKNLGILAQ